MALYDDKKVNPFRQHSSLKCECTKQQSYSICEVKTDKNSKKEDNPQLQLETSAPLSTTDRARQKIRKDISSKQYNQQTGSNKHL